MAIHSTEAFLDVLSKSKLLSDPEMEKVRAASGGHADARSLAKALVTDKTLTRWQAGQLLAGRASFMLGKYRLIELLSRGGMGSVFVAEHTTMNRRVALKIISKQMGRDPAKLERFLGEARTIAALDDVNIVRAYDIDHEGERYFLVMEYVEGRDLQQMVEEDGPLDFARAADYIRQAALGLAHAHERNMIHRDVKPANLIINRQNVVKILDLGMARLIAEGASGSDADEKIIGTIDYMSPEQALESEGLDHRTDIYSLGCTLYFLLTGRPPFGEGTLPQRIMKHQTQEPPSLSQYRAGTPEALDAACRRMMAKKPEDRFQTAAEVAEALEPWSAAAESEAAPEAPGNGLPVARPLDDGERGPEAETGIKIIVTESGSLRGRKAPTRSRGEATASAVAPLAGGRRPVTGLAGFLADPMRKWITILSAVLALLVVLAGGLFWMFGGEGTRASADASSALREGVPQNGSATPKKPAISVEESDLGSGLENLDSAFGPAKIRSGAEDKTLPSAPRSAAGDKPAAAPDGQGNPPAVAKKPAVPEAKKGVENAGEGKQPGAKQPDSKPAGAGPLAGGATAPAGAASPGPATKPGGAETGEKPKPESSPAGGETEKTKPGKPETPAGKQSEGEEKGAKPAAPKEKPEEDPLADFPDTVDLPILADGDPPGEKSRAPLDLGTIRTAASPWQLVLLGGETALKGERKYVLVQTNSDAAKAAWTIHMESSGTGAAAGLAPVARFWRNENALMFAWDDNAQAITANYLRNCVLQPRVGGKAKATALTQPLKADPIPFDLLRGMNNSSAALKWAPEDERLRIKFDGVDGWEGAKFDPAEPAPPKTPVTLTFIRKDRYQNESAGAVFRILATTKKTSTNVELRLTTPEPRAFKMIVGNSSEQQIGVARDRLENQRRDVERRAAQLRGEGATKASREVDALAMQIWYLDLVLQVQNKALLHYKIVTDAGGEEVVLVTTR